MTQSEMQGMPGGENVRGQRLFAVGRWWNAPSRSSALVTPNTTPTLPPCPKNPQDWKEKLAQKAA